MPEDDQLHLFGMSLQNSLIPKKTELASLPDMDQHLCRGRNMNTDDEVRATLYPVSQLTKAHAKAYKACQMKNGTKRCIVYGCVLVQRACSRFQR